MEGADVLLIHNAGEILAWPENPGAFALILNAAGISWTMSSELAAYDSINYGLWYDDAQFARVALKHAEAARKLKVKRIVLGECGHAHKALAVIADRILGGDLNIPRQSFLPLLRDIVASGRLELDPARNDFPVTLHDPCNLVRLMGVVEPQREILRTICPQFREMEPHGVDNYCCGGGSGFAIMSGHNFPDWRFHVSGRKKLEQVLNAFQDCLDPSIPKYLCAPCSNCKGQFRDMLAYYGLWEKPPDPVRRPRGTHRERHDRRETRVYRVGVALMPNAATEDAERSCAAGECEAAIELFERAVRLEPCDFRLHYRLGLCYGGGCRSHALVHPDMADCVPAASASPHWRGSREVPRGGCGPVGEYAVPQWEHTQSGGVAGGHRVPYRGRGDLSVARHGR